MSWERGRDEILDMLERGELDSDAVMADLPAARELVDAAEKVIPHLTVFGP